MEEEVWKPVVGYEGLYEVSNLGRVRNVGSGKNRVYGQIIKPQINRRWGYWQVGLRDGIGKWAKTHRLHRVVAIAFLGPVPSGYEVNHLDGDKGNNRLENIEYCTPSANHLHRCHVLGKISPTAQLRRCGEKNTMAKLSREQVEEIKTLLEHKVLPQTKIAARYGVSQTCVSKIKCGQRWVED